MRHLNLKQDATCPSSPTLVEICAVSILFKKNTQL